MILKYDQKNDRLVYLETKATSDFWDDLWKDDELEKTIRAGGNDKFVSTVTRLFLKPSKKIRVLEGGCGKGQYVYSLHGKGYDVYGIDFAKKTVEQIKKVAPELNIRHGDVRKLPFPENYFHGYWSLGVIEHFYDGYESIADEMARVIRPGGYLFITFPYMSPLRKIKARLNSYTLFDETHFNHNDFYQFALNKKKVIRSFQDRGFHLKFRKSLDGCGGLKRETGSQLLKQILFSLEKGGPFRRLTRIFIDLLIAPATGHTILLVLKKTSV